MVQKILHRCTLGSRELGFFREEIVSGGKALFDGEVEFMRHIKFRTLDDANNERVEVVEACSREKHYLLTASLELNVLSKCGDKKCISEFFDLLIVCSVLLQMQANINR